MNLFEEEMRSFFKDDTILAGKVYYEKMVIGCLNDTTVVKVHFENFCYADHYTGFKVEIINKQCGAVDVQCFQWSHLINGTSGKKDKHPCLWVCDGVPQWKDYTLSTMDKKNIMKTIINYILMYV